jgi:S1/P1 Nuclease
MMGININCGSRVLFLAIAIFVSTEKALAWGDLGHETVAEIAERIIAKDQKIKIAVQAIIGVEPLAVSATWPDKVRNDERFDDFAAYHFITEYKNPLEKSDKSALAILQKYPNVLTSPSAPREAKMIALRYLVHVVGDIHQPLHVGNEFDRGGNYCQVLWQPDLKKPTVKVNLHSVWDTNLVDYIAAKVKSQLKEPVKYFSYRQLADGLTLKHKKLIDENLGQTIDIAKWVRESSDLRKSNVYPDAMAENARPYCKEKREEINQNSIPVLDGLFAEQKAEIAEKRIVLAGARLATMILKIFSESKTHAPVEQEILNMLKLSDNH